MGNDQQFGRRPRIELDQARLSAMRQEKDGRRLPARLVLATVLAAFVVGFGIKTSGFAFGSKMRPLDRTFDSSGSPQPTPSDSTVRN